MKFKWLLPVVVLIGFLSAWIKPSYPSKTEMLKNIIAEQRYEKQVEINDRFISLVPELEKFRGCSLTLCCYNINVSDYENLWLFVSNDKAVASLYF